MTEANQVIFPSLSWHQQKLPDDGHEVSASIVLSSSCTDY